MQKDVNMKIKHLKNPNEISYLHSDFNNLKDSAAESMNKTSIVFRDFQTPQPSKSPNIYSKSFFYFLKLKSFEFSDSVWVRAEKPCVPHFSHRNQGEN